MTRHRNAILALAILGTGMFEGTEACAQTATASAPTGPTTAGLVDLPSNHWAYGAIQVLMERYKVVGGFPDKTFRGEKAVSRYELAAALAQIMDKVQSRGEEKVSPSDRELVSKLRGEFGRELLVAQQVKTQTDALEKRTDSLEKDMADLKGWRAGFKEPQSVVDKVKGHLEVNLIDDPGDRLFPYWTTGARIGIEGKVNDSVSASFGVGGGYAAKQISVSPAVAGADKPPAGEIKLSGSAGLTAKFTPNLTSTTKFGSFGIGSLMSLKGYAGHWGDGLIGSGLAEPNGSPARGGRDMALASKVDFKGLSAALGVTSQLAATYFGWDFGVGNINFIADVDHDSIGGVVIKSQRAYDMALSLNFGSEKLGMSVKGGVKGSGNFLADTYQPLASVQGIVNLWSAELVVGAGFKQGPEKTNPTQQLQPAIYVYLPPPRDNLPSLLFGLTEPYTLAGKKTGEGSLLGDKSGWTVQLGYDNPILPNLVVEADYQQDLLFSDKYDGWAYAISTGVDF